jgi:CRP/FNR family transcriptional regulator, nitrogen oxide reductase regulator
MAVQRPLTILAFPIAGGTMTADNSHLKARLASIQGSPFFQGLSPSDCDQIAAKACDQNFLRKQIIFREGDPVNFIFLLASGQVKVTRLSRDGSEVILGVAQPGDVLGGLGSSFGGVHLASAQALKDCSLHAWRSHDMDEFENRFAPLRRNNARILAERLRLLEERFRELATEPVSPRLASTLLRLLPPSSRGNSGEKIDLTYEELACMIGTTLFTVSRLLSDWKSRGLIHTGRRSIVIKDRKGLSDLAESA